MKTNFIFIITCWLSIITSNVNGKSLKAEADSVNDDNDVFRIGFGIGDITGPAAEINMMGYAKLGQDSAGIHLRLYARSTVISDKYGKRIAYVNVDLCGSTQLVKILALEELEKIYGKNVYTHENVMISATHTHAGPGGYFQYLVYLVTTEGYIKESTLAIVSGIVKSIRDAHTNMRPGRIQYAESQLFNTTVNRSPASYLLNPKEERDQYEDNTDKTIQLLKFTDLNGKPIGMINWHAVHGVSMNNSNKLISSDNKGYAAITFEKDFNGYSNVGKGPFVAIFSQANEGDASPNTNGARCLDTGKPCDFVHSTCNGKNELCVAFGPGKDMFESTKMIGELQYLKAKQMFEEANETVKGDVHYIYQNIDMSDRIVTIEDGSARKTCSPALGYSFAAGTTDGEGASVFIQGTKKGNESKFFDVIRDLIAHPTKEQIECHAPKAILLALGNLKKPYPWVPTIVPTQIFEIGDLVIVGLPGEFTTMSGRRIRNDIKKIYADHNRNVHVILAGLSNTYSNYIATFEEYQLQRYEGGSTMFGPYTLHAYRDQFKYLAKHLIARESGLFPGPELPNLLSKQITLKPGVIFDKPFGHHFGEVYVEPKHVYHIGEIVEVKFVGANPRNNLRLEKTFLTVEKLENDEWKVIATDANWETQFHWKRHSKIVAGSEVTIKWEIPESTKPGVYRIQYFGDWRKIIGTIYEFKGTTRSFKVVP